MNCIAIVIYREIFRCASGWQQALIRFLMKWVATRAHRHTQTLQIWAYAEYWEHKWVPTSYALQDEYEFAEESTVWQGHLITFCATNPFMNYVRQCHVNNIVGDWRQTCTGTPINHARALAPNDNKNAENSFVCGWLTDWVRACAASCLHWICRFYARLPIGVRLIIILSMAAVGERIAIEPNTHTCGIRCKWEICMWRSENAHSSIGAYLHMANLPSHTAHRSTGKWFNKLLIAAQLFRRVHFACGGGGALDNLNMPLAQLSAFLLFQKFCYFCEQPATSVRRPFQLQHDTRHFPLSCSPCAPHNNGRLYK